MVKEKSIDNQIGELLDLQFQLIEATKKWSEGIEPNAGIDSIRHKAIQLNHIRYSKLIPSYRKWAQDNNLPKTVDMNLIVNQLMLTGDIFKNYDSDWLKNKDFSLLTKWLESTFTRPLNAIPMDDIKEIAGWRQRLRDNGIFLSYSSGSSGKMSFLPRDPITWKALINNSKIYSNPYWSADSNGTIRPFNCLITGFRGDGMGIQGAAVGLSKAALNTHYMLDEILTENMVKDHTLNNIQTYTKTADQSEDTIYGNEANLRSSVEFLQNSVRENRPVLVFGTPFMIRRLCLYIAAEYKNIRLVQGSIVVTGGGWKSFVGEKVPLNNFRKLIYDSLSIDFASIIDAYSSVELNCTFISCKELRYHIPPLIEPVVLDEALIGEVGRPGYGLLGFLDPFASSYPGFLISGDQGHLVKVSCECGISGWAIEGEIERASNHEMRGCGGVIESLLA